MGMNIGTEIYGKNERFERPVLIIHVYNSETALVLPVTTKANNRKYYFPIHFNGKDSFVLLSQPRTVSTRRFWKREAALDPIIFKPILDQFINSIMQNPA